MPLKPGKTQDVVQENISELLDKYHNTGRIGKIKPTSEGHARSIATAIARDKAGLPRRPKRARRQLRRKQ